MNWCGSLSGEEGMAMAERRSRKRRLTPRQRAAAMRNLKKAWAARRRKSRRKSRRRARR